MKIPDFYQRFSFRGTKSIVVCSLLLLLSVAHTFAQCAMCTATVESHTTDGGAKALTLNSGILYLLLMPWALAMIIGLLWYKSYRKRTLAAPAPDMAIGE